MPAQPNRSLTDGIAILGQLCARGNPVGTRELARAMGWEPTRANRLLGTLRDLGLAEQDAERRYRPGPGVHLLAAQCLHGSGLLAAALPVLRQLQHADIGWSLGVLWNGNVSYLIWAKAGQPIEEGLYRHTMFPAEKSAIGKVLEAYTPGIAARNPESELSEARRTGWAVQHNPDHTGSVAVTIPGPVDGAPPVAGLSAMADLVTYPPKKIAAMLLPAAHAIAAAMHRTDS